MKEVEIRYSKIKKIFPREFVLLQGTGCFWKKCSFCDYHNDITPDPFKINRQVLDKVTGEFGVLDVINSGSAMELDKKTLELLINKAQELSIKEIWFEAHWAYRNQLQEFAQHFKNSHVKFRTGVETFDPDLRTLWNKGIPSHVTAEEISKYFSAVCLLAGTEGQSFSGITTDTELANKYFERFIINVFIPNSTGIKPNNELIDRFMKEIYPKIKDNPKAEILINNTDLGVG